MNTQSPSQRNALYDLPAIIARGAFSKSHLYNLTGRGQFPAPVLRCGPRFTRWSAADVDTWFADPAAWITAHQPTQKNQTPAPAPV